MKRKAKVAREAGAWDALMERIPGGRNIMDIIRPLTSATRDEPPMPTATEIGQGVARTLFAVRQHVEIVFRWLEDSYIPSCCDAELLGEGQALADELEQVREPLERIADGLCHWLEYINCSSLVALDREAYGAVCTLAETALPHPNAQYINLLVGAAVKDFAGRKDAPAVVAKEEQRRLRGCKLKSLDHWPWVQKSGAPWNKGGKSGKASRGPASAGKAARSNGNGKRRAKASAAKTTAVCA